MRKFFKYEALGNDYIVIDPKNFDITMNSENIVKICHRNFGCGSDGILYGPIFKEDKIFLKIFNPDGSEAEKSGNGIRIFSKYLKDEGYIKDESFKLQTKGGEVLIKYLNNDGSVIKVSMGKVSFNSRDIGVNGDEREVIEEYIHVIDRKFNITSLSIGNPHTVCIFDKLDDESIHKYGKYIENHEMFINRTNVQFVEVIDRNTIKIKIHERGAGYTLASGSSSCAAASVCYKLSLVDSDILVKCDGGDIRVQIDDDGEVFMTGEVSRVYDGVLRMNL
ncbi:diaminopimelate epimerase [Candidatus Arthromitus sp. SFB-rat-Yit]|uniref:diaminopimelate epimerase n=1 Tax=Candidatus Arthromitus sp. SFB-rat-Yit TaxID=1041504 RepID=UPI000227A04E|nr:diaminopimelate epimerase [Candidatus Arthromitus sp. SFB-rat-Yit]BAK80722.1 diaminopimelate epimerase [Candidatus Arthromitus sp. SFB-rat-Yit]